MLYALLWVTLSLPVIDKLCIHFGFWHYLEDGHILSYMPFDLYFNWVVIWGVIVTYFFKTRHIPILILFLFWIDLVIIPHMETYGILRLGSNWLVGELLVILFVLLPAQVWARASFTGNPIWLRSFFQVCSIILLFCILFPFLLSQYSDSSFDFSFLKTAYLLQVVFITSLPGLAAVVDLYVFGKGTPFPYDKTERLVTNGIYSYIRNPIQLTLTLVFIPLSFTYNDYWLLMGIALAIFYSQSIAVFHEGYDMERRFGQPWNAYKASVPRWYFLWRPKEQKIKGMIFFKNDCNICQQVRSWFEAKNPMNLEFRHATDVMNQVTYQYEDKNVTSVIAISYALGHINLLWASLGWFMRIPPLCFLIQAIVDVSLPPIVVDCEIPQTDVKNKT